MSSDQKVEPRLISGFRDISQRDTILKREVLRILIEQFELAGFDPLETATVHLEDVLFGSDGYTDMAYFRAWGTRKRQKADRAKMALRFDLTVPLARYVVAEFDNLPRPFARWQIGQVFRGEKPSAGRFCEFSQLDIDLLWAPGGASDAQIVTLIYNAMVALGVTKFKVKLNNRKILNGLPALIGFSPNGIKAVLQILDSRDSETEEEIRKRLKALGKAKSPLVLTDVQVDQLLDFTNIGGSNLGKLHRVGALMTGIDIAQEGVEEIERILELTLASGVPDEAIDFNLSMVRGLGYYTGPVFETVLTDKVAQELGIGAVFSGGRYDNLVERFSDVSVPATGASFGLDRFLVWAKEVNLFETPKTRVEVLVAYQLETQGLAMRLAADLRASGVRTRMYDGEDFSFRNQIGYANLLGIPVVVIIGEHEADTNTLTIKNMVDRKQKSVPVEEVISSVESVLGRI